MNTTCTFTLESEYGQKVKALYKMTNRNKSSQKLQIGYKVLDK